MLLLINALIVILMDRAVNEYGFYRTWRYLALTRNGRDLFSSKLIWGLPLPAKRYLLHSIQRGTTLYNRVELELEGAVRSGRDSKWLPFEATEILSRGRGFVWKAKIRGHSLVQSVGGERYCDGEGIVRFSTLGVWPALKESGPSVDLSLAGRAVIDSIWIPTVFLAQRGAKWEYIDERNARVTTAVGSYSGSIEMWFGENGGLKEATIQRYRKREDGRATLEPFSIKVVEEKTFDGLTIPSKITAGWGTGTGQHEECYRAIVKHAGFH